MREDLATGIATAHPEIDEKRGAFRWAVALFGLTMFMGSGLLFLVQPMFAKLALPRLGGSPSVWNTCVLFFQTTLLLGYLYAHFSTRWLGVRRQVGLHLILLLLPLLTLPVTLGDSQPPASAANPVWWLLRTMALTVGLPFFVVSTSAPLLQRWFAALPVPSARDPYFLYSASNLGSMLALLSYPVLLEPSTGTRHQTWIWAAGYALLVCLTASCGFLVRAFAAERPRGPASAADPLDSLSVRTRLQWVVLSFVPSSLMLGVTTHISTDIAAVPLLWVLPLAMYLGTFVLVFSKREFFSHRWLIRLAPPLILGCLLTLLFNGRAWWLVPLHLTTFFVVAMVCHRELALRRPSVEHLTNFYIWMSFGGMLGGVFNTLLAPQIFSGVLEYPLMLACAALVRPSPGFRGSRPDPIPLLLGLPAFVLLLCVGAWAAGLTSAGLGLRPLLLAFAVMTALASMFANRIAAFGLMALIFVGVIAFGRPEGAGRVLLSARSFFGVHRVIDAVDHRFHLLQHGSTTHGRQEMPAVSSCEPTAYYHPKNPIGQLFEVAQGRFKRVAVVGLGSGALACYARPGDLWTFYEIDPVVERIARDPRYFTYLKNSPGRLDIVLGDGRLTLQRALPGAYDLIILDAFSSDAIPVHLLTREAMELYLSRLQPFGIVAVHVSNRYVNLEPVLAALASEDGLTALANIDDRIPQHDAARGRFASHWVMMARMPEPLADLAGRSGWHAAAMNAHVKPWTDDYSNILQVLTRR
jgi:spermidine synthase